MMKQKTKRKVGFRFDETTIALLDKVRNESSNELYLGRSKTWLIEYAIRQMYQPAMAEQEANNGQS
jgi:hypothetical protein